MVYVTDPKRLAPKDKIRYICEVMAMRARGRAEIKAAEAKRAKRASKRAKNAVIAAPELKMRKHMGVVSDELYGPAISLGCRPWQVEWSHKVHGPCF